MKTIVLEKEECIQKAADRIQTLLEEKPDAVLALATGRTMTGLYQELARRCSAGALSLKQARVFAVTEFEAVDDALSCASALRKLAEVTDLAEEKLTLLCPDNVENYDALLSEAGGLDLAVLGLGDNAHIGFNEPATPFDSKTHRQKLTAATKRQYASVFGSEDAVPDYGLTMGIHTLTSARDILVLAFGDEKAEAVFKMLYARNDSAVPAAFLQIPSQVTVYVDGAAAKKL